MKILTGEYLTGYKKKNRKKLLSDLNKLSIGRGDNNFEYNLESSAIYSSNIEGNTIDLNSFMNSKLLKKKISSQKHKEITDLIEAYIFAGINSLNETNLLRAHEIFSKQFLIKGKQGSFREESISVFDANGLVYKAVEPELVKTEIRKLFEDIKYLNNIDLSTEEVFYYASLIHLKLAHIHPFMDGNGRIARLAEKWFLSMKINEIAWKIKSEKYYFENRNKYYENINLGQNYYELNCDNCFPFLEMLSKSIKYH